MAAAHDDGVGVFERERDEVVAGAAAVAQPVRGVDGRRGKVAVDLVRRPGDVVAAAVADEDVLPAAAEDAVVAVAAVDDGESATGVHDEVALDVGRRAGLVAAPDDDRPGTGGLDEVRAGIAEQLRGATALEDDDVLIGAAVDGDGNRHARQDPDRVVPAAEVGDDVRDVVEQVAAPERGDLDERLILIQAELLDAEGLRVIVGGDIPELAAAADVQHELAADVGIPVSGRRHGAARPTAQEHWLGQLQHADLEFRRLLDREEPEVDLHGHAEVDRHAAVALRVEGEIEADAGQGDAEDLDLHGGAAGQLEDEVGIADGVGDDLGPHPEVELSLQSEGLRAEQHGAAQVDVEVALRVDEHAAAQPNDTEEVDVGGRPEGPLVASDFDPQARVELEHF